MTKKLLPAGVFTLLFYVFPLLPRTELLFTPQMFYLILMCGILFGTQPPLTVEESRTNRHRDKHSVWVIMGSVALIQVTVVVEWAYFREAFHPFRMDALTLTGLLLTGGGTLFRIWCIRTLGTSFTTTVRTQAQQRIVTSGAYRYIRHPSYLGAYLAIVGSACFLHAYTALLLAGSLILVAYAYRMKFEEIALVEDFGDAYRDYQRTTKKLLPLIY